MFLFLTVFGIDFEVEINFYLKISIKDTILKERLLMEENNQKSVVDQNLDQNLKMEDMIFQIE